MKVYTKKGDKGATDIIGKRISKADIRVDAYGTIDTLNSNLNLVMSCDHKYDDYLIRISNYLFKVGFDLASIEPNDYKVNEDEIKWLEEQIDLLTEQMENFNYFVLPGGSEVASRLHICRCICRECERKIIQVDNAYSTNPHVLSYINRLSDFLYILACYDNHVNKIKLIPVTF